MSKVFSTDESKAFYTQERCFVIEILNSDDITDSIAQIRVLPGITTALHRLKEVKESYYILSGEGEMEIEGEGLGIVGSGDVVHIPAGKTQRIKNIGNEDLIFIAICSPRFTPECYEHLE